MADSRAPQTTASLPAAHVARLRTALERRLGSLALPERPPELYDAVRYGLQGPGKRIRPVLLLLAAEAAGGRASRALPAALAAEVFHTFTLIHDDIMDNAHERRGRATIHVVWDQNTAILAGDFLMGLSYELLAQTRTPHVAALIHCFHRMMAAVCEGQALDEAFGARDHVSVEDYLDMIGRKTAALLGCVMELGALVARADPETTARLFAAGRALGTAFQIQDDLLDLTAADEAWGKPIGGDLVEGKKTFLLLQALARAEGEERAWFQRIVTGRGLPPEKVPEARSRMAALGVLAEATRAVALHSQAALDALAGLPESQAKQTLLWLTRRLAARAT